MKKVEPGELLKIALEGLAPASAQGSRYDLDHFASYRRAESAATALRDLIAMPHEKANRVVADYLADMEAKGQSANTVRRRLTAIKGSVTRARRASLTTLALDVPRPKLSAVRITRGPDPETWTRLLGQAESEAAGAGARYTGKRFIRDLAIVLLFGERGLLRNEVMGLDYPADVDIDAPAIHVKDAWIPISEKILKALVWWVDVRGRWDGPLFIAMDKAQARMPPHRISPRALTQVTWYLSRRAGLKDRVTPLELRNAAIVRGIASGWDARQLLEFSRTVTLPNFLEQEWGKDARARVQRPRRSYNTSKGCPVTLRAPGVPAFVLGCRKPLLSPEQHRVIEALVRAYPDGLTGPELRVASRCGDARGILARLVESDSDWRAVIRFPETTRGGRYRIVRPGSDL